MTFLVVPRLELGNTSISAAAERIADAGATWVHVHDKAAAAGGRNQWTRLAPLLAMPGVKVQLGGGLRSMTQVQQLLDVGVERIVIGTQAVLNPDWARELCRIFPGRVVLWVEERNGAAVVKDSLETTGRKAVDVLAELADAQCAAFLVESDAGPLAAYRDARRALGGRPVLVAGVTTGAQAEELLAQGAAGAVVDLPGDLEAILAAFPQPRHKPPMRVLRAREEGAFEEPEAADGADEAPEDAAGRQEWP